MAIRGGSKAMKKHVQLILLTVTGVLIVLLLIVILSLSLNKSREERDAVIEILAQNQEEAQGEDTADSENAQSGEAAQNSEAAKSSEPEQEKKAEASASPAVETQKEITVGALDDVQDPQSETSTGNEAGTGAEVNVANLSPDETKGITIGIDVSKYQGTIDWAKVKEAGIEFAMIRVGYRAKSTGEIFEDPTARYNLQEAQAAGIKLGAYFFSCAVSEEEARAEAVFTKNIIAKYKITYPVAYNCEDFQSKDSRQNGLDIQTRTGLAQAFLDEIAAGGYTPMFYAAK